jgi:hypothetical protein
MRVSEWICGGFFAYLVVLARVFPLPGRRRTRVLLVGLVCVGLVAMLSQLRLQWPMRVARDWVPTVYLLEGYWLCGLFFARPMRALEQRLLRLDRRVFSVTQLARFSRRAPRALLELLEVAYLCAYPFVPATLGLLQASGLRTETDRFWTAVLIASFGCYGMLPWLQTRPPRSIEQAGPIARRGLAVRRLNLAVLTRGSVQVNTLPSGHTATALAAALVVGELLPGLLPVLLAIALTIAVATVVGRYHYTLDTVLGLAVGVVGWWASGVLVA